MSLQIVLPSRLNDVEHVPPGVSPECNGFGPDAHRLISVASRLGTEQRKIAAGTGFLPFEGAENYIFVVLDGWMIKQSILEDGRRQILEFVLPGDLVVGSGSGPTEDVQSIEALTEATVALIPYKSLGNCAQTFPDIAVRLVEAMQNTLSSAYENLIDTGRRTSLEAVAHFLLRIDERAAAVYGRSAAGDVPFPLIQEHIGDAIGLTAVHVCRTLRKLKAGGAIETGRGYLRIVDREKLASFAGICDFNDGDIHNLPRRLAS